MAIGGMPATETVEGRRRHPVLTRYAPELREDLHTLGELPVRTPTGATVALRQVARLSTAMGAPMIRSEDGRLLFGGGLLLLISGSFYFYARQTQQLVVVQNSEVARSLVARVILEHHPGRQHRRVVARKIIRFQKQEDPPATLFPDRGLLGGSRRPRVRSSGISDC